jgi:glycosyltransferase involved in cell wall biosynthesis
MSPTLKADVIVPVGRDRPLEYPCLEAVLERSGPFLNRLIVVHDHGAESEFACELERFASRDDRVRILANAHPLGFAGSCNHGLGLREGDAVLLAPDCIVTHDWLSELAAVAHSEERTACVSPLANVGGLCSVPELNRFQAPDALAEDDVRDACAGLPRWTVVPLLPASCVYLRGSVIEAVGSLDAGLSTASFAFDHWVERAQALGFIAKRANHVYVRGSSPDPVATAEQAGRAAPEEGHVRHQFERFSRSLDGHLAAHAVGMHSTGRIRVAYDIRHLPYEQVGTRTYAVCLAQALARRPDVDLTLLVREPSQARGLTGRVVTHEQCGDDVAVIHRPAQIFSPREFKLLFGSSAHLVVTYQDLIGYRIPLVFPTDAEADGYRATSSLTMPAAQRIIALSENAANEITSEFGIPRDEIEVVPLGVDAGWFARREEDDVAIQWGLGLPPHYFLSLATDFPHKNLPSLLNAYAILRSWWKGSEPPGLVLAGHATSSRAGLYGRMGSRPMGQGLSFLGAVSREELRVLYQNALALVYPSLYEGFGLPPLEAMAAGTPVIAMPISSVPEVVGDCALYPGGLSSRDLARAMEAVACDEGLRAEFRDRGLRRVDQFRWEDTARATVAAYRSAIRNPSPRSLQMRRHLQDALMCWGEPIFPPAVLPEPPKAPEPLGIRNAWRALNFALYTRLRRELERFHPPAGRESA